MRMSGGARVPARRPPFNGDPGPEYRATTRTVFAGSCASSAGSSSPLQVPLLEFHAAFVRFATWSRNLSPAQKVTAWYGAAPATKWNRTREPRGRACTRPGISDPGLRLQPKQLRTTPDTDEEPEPRRFQRCTRISPCDGCCRRASDGVERSSEALRPSCGAQRWQPTRSRRSKRGLFHPPRRSGTTRRPPPAASSERSDLPAVDHFRSTADLMSFRSCRSALFATPLNSNAIGIDISLVTIV